MQSIIVLSVFYGLNCAPLPANLYVEALNPNVTYLKVGPIYGVIRVK